MTVSLKQLIKSGFTTRQAQVLETLRGDQTTPAVHASDVQYDTSTSHLSDFNVQTVIDDLAWQLGEVRKDTLKGQDPILVRLNESSLGFSFADDYAPIPGPGVSQHHLMTDVVKLAANGYVDLEILTLNPNYDDVVAGCTVSVVVKVMKLDGTQRFIAYSDEVNVPLSGAGASAVPLIATGQGTIGADLAINAGHIRSTAGGVFSVSVDYQVTASF